MRLNRTKSRSRGLSPDQRPACAARWRAVAIVALLLAGQAQADPGGAVSIPARAAAALPAPSDRHDVLVLLDSGPLHVRMHLALGGVSLAESRRQYVAKLMDNLDADRDGKLTRKEADRSPILRTKQRPGATQFLESLRAQSSLMPRDVAKKIDALGGVPVGYREDLTSSKNDVEVFKLFDANANGLLDGPELSAAADLIMSKDEDGDQCVAFQEFFPPPPPPDPLQVAVVGAIPATETPLITVAKNIRDATAPDMPARLIRKYNRRLDRGLDAVELGWTSDRLAALDGDGNGLLDEQELKLIRQAEPDVDMAVDLRPSDQAGGVITLVGGSGQRLDAAARPDYAKLGFAGSVVTFSHRNLDPIPAAIDNAMRQFNLLDADANGYLGRDEVAERIRFQRELFELTDADGDDKVFADEMKDYVRARAEPAATTCRVNMYDTGNGFFMALDSNADGRVSEREKRNAAQALAQLDRDGQPGIGQTEPVRHFHIEFVRGSYQLFGASEQLLSQTPAFQQRTPSGPIWFQRMDRNNDGDLTWSEFLGPLEVYHQLDGDRDDLVDPQEAATSK